MVVEVRIDCDKCGDVVFTTVYHPDEIEDEIPCPACGTMCEVKDKHYVGHDDIKVTITPKPESTFGSLKRKGYGKEGFKRED